jgi:isopropylmalate/homocitrate/citramalate synthase
LEDALDERYPVVMGNNSGRVAFRRALDGMSIELSPSSFEQAFARMERAANLTGQVSEAQIQAIVDEVVTGAEILQEVAESFQ